MATRRSAIDPPSREHRESNDLNMVIIYAWSTIERPVLFCMHAIVQSVAVVGDRETLTPPRYKWAPLQRRWHADQHWTSASQQQHQQTEKQSHEGAKW